MTDGSSCTSNSCSTSEVTERACRVHHVSLSAFYNSHTANPHSEFPRIPSGILKQHLSAEADGRLGHYISLPEDIQLPPGVEIPPRPQLPEGVIDAPLIRVYNFLREFFAFTQSSDLLVIQLSFHLFRDNVDVVSARNSLLPGS